LQWGLAAGRQGSGSRIFNKIFTQSGLAPEVGGGAAVGYRAPAHCEAATGVTAYQTELALLKLFCGSESDEDDELLPLGF